MRTHDSIIRTTSAVDSETGLATIIAEDHRGNRLVVPRKELSTTWSDEVYEEAARRFWNTFHPGRTVTVIHTRVWESGTAFSVFVEAPR